MSQIFDESRNEMLSIFFYVYPSLFKKKTSTASNKLSQAINEYMYLCVCVAVLKLSIMLNKIWSLYICYKIERRLFYSNKTCLLDTAEILLNYISHLHWRLFAFTVFNINDLFSFDDFFLYELFSLTIFL